VILLQGDGEVTITEPILGSVLEISVNYIVFVGATVDRAQLSW